MKTEGTMSIDTSKIIKHISDAAIDTYIVAIAGGTASGKSWLSQTLSVELIEMGYDVATLHIDDFALGKVFPEKKTSRYKWDDPANYRLDEAFLVLQDFLVGKQREYLSYTLEDHYPAEVSQLIWVEAAPSNGRKVIIIEGLFSWRKPFDTLPHLKIFLEVNFFHRYVLRLYRNTVKRPITSFSTVTEQYFGFVKRAHLELLEPMKETADIVLQNMTDVRSILSDAPVLPVDSNIKDKSVIYEDSFLHITYGYLDGHPIVEVMTPRGIILRGEVGNSRADLKV